jgi:hypothetical protein
MDVEAFKALLKSEMPNRQICQEVLFSSDMWLVMHKEMGESAYVYDRMTSFFSKKLEMAKRNVAIVGSAKIGFSLHPEKGFRAFNDDTSDIDVVLVWPDKFAEFWREMLKMFYSKTAHIPAATRKEVFRKFVTLRREDQWPAAAFQDWHRAMDELKRDFFTEFSVGNAIKYRVYESWDAAEAYHANGIGILRAARTGS